MNSSLTPEQKTRIQATDFTRLSIKLLKNYKRFRQLVIMAKPNLTRAQINEARELFEAYHEFSHEIADTLELAARLWTQAQNDTRKGANKKSAKSRAASIKDKKP